MAKVRLYRTYRFIDKDPVIDEIRTVVADCGLSRRLKIVSELSGVSETTLNNWFKGDTKKPQNASLGAVSTALGYERKFTRIRELDVEAELKTAKAWSKRQRDKEKEERAR